MNTRTAAFLGTLALALPTLAQQAGAPPGTAADPHAGHGMMMSAPAPAPAPAPGPTSGQPPTGAAADAAATASTAPVPTSAASAAAPAPAAGTMPRGMMHGAGPVDRDRDGIPGGHEAHGAAAAGGMAHGSGMGRGMGGCKMMGGRGGMMGGGHSGHDVDDEAFHRDLMARIDRMENRLILMEMLLRERLKTP